MRAFPAPLFAVRTWFRLQIYADVLGLFSASSGGARHLPRKLAGIKTPRAVSAMGWKGIRSGPT